MKTKHIQWMTMLTLVFVLTGCPFNNNDNPIDNTPIAQVLTVQEKAIAKIKSYASSNGSSSIPTLQDYLDAGVTGLDVSELADINEVVGNLTSAEVDTTGEIQALADAIGVNIDTTAPVFTSSNTASVNENQTSAITLVATDDSTVTYSISGTDATSFTVNGLTGVVIFNTAPDFETKDTYTFTATATDALNNSSTQAVTITILDVNDTIAQPVNEPFKIKIKTDNLGTSSDTQFEIPTTGDGYLYNVDCDNDGVDEDSNVTGNYTCNYVTAGEYTISISGTFPQIYFINEKDKRKLLEIVQWGTGAWRSMSSAFFGCSNMSLSASDAPNLTNVRRMAGMFARTADLNGSISHWDVSSVTNMQGMFNDSRRNSVDLSGWDVSSVTNMSSMFHKMGTYEGNLSAWDVSSVTDMSGMFLETNFNQDITSWNVSKVKDMSNMFEFNGIFNQDIGNWNTSSVTNMRAMFNFARNFNQDIGGWDVSSVKDMAAMFKKTNAFNQNLRNWHVGNVTTMGAMFNYAIAFTNQNLRNWNVHSVTFHIGFMTNAGSGNTEPNWP